MDNQAPETIINAQPTPKSPEPITVKQPEAQAAQTRPETSNTAEESIENLNVFKTTIDDLKKLTKVDPSILKTPEIDQALASIEANINQEMNLTPEQAVDLKLLIEKFKASLV